MAAEPDASASATSATDDAAAASALADSDEQVGAEDHSGTAASSEEQEEDQVDDEADVGQLRRMFHGVEMKKHGRWGFPKARIMWLDARHSEMVLRWGPVASRKDPHEAVDGSLPVEQTPDRVLRFGEIVAVKQGAHGAELARRAGDAKAPCWVVFMAERRCLSVEVDSQEQAEALSKAMNRFVTDHEVFNQAVLYLFRSGMLPPDEYPMPEQQHE
jgi:hypothetical protein